MSNTTRSRNRRAQALALPDQTVTLLSFGAAIIFVVYIALVIFTITLATMQTSLAAQVRQTEGAISQLETTYYAAIAKQNENSPASIGLVRPSVVQYAVAKPAAGISFAGN
jgi:hypothetical protein